MNAKITMASMGHHKGGVVVTTLQHMLEYIQYTYGLNSFLAITLHERGLGLLLRGTY